jgi:hypothetical protein
MVRIPGRDQSQHFGATVERTVRVNEAAAGYGTLGQGSTMPPGSLVVELHHGPDDERLLGAFVMSKMPAGSEPRTGDWEYVVLDAELRVLARGALAPCARCHAAARHDALFGPPRP